MEPKFYITRIWFNRQYRMTYRAVIEGLLASGVWFDQPDDVVVTKAHELTVASLQQYKAAEV